MSKMDMEDLIGGLEYTRREASSRILAQKEAKKRSPLKEEVDPKAKSTSSSTESMSKSNAGSQLLDKPKWEPENWTDVLSNIREEHNKPIRGQYPCNLCTDGYVSPTVLRYQALVSLVLKKASEEKSVESAMLRLRKHGLTIPNIVKTDEKLILKLIYPLISWKTKATDIKKMTQILHDEHQGDLPVSLEKLMKLPGVEPKMALICMNFSRESTDLSANGSVVANRLGWVREPTKTIFDTTEALESWLPLELREEVYHLLGVFSYLQCQGRVPSCEKCPNNTVCPYGKNRLEHLRDLGMQ